MTKRMLFLGDSHSGYVRDAMRELRPDIQVIGGPLPFPAFWQCQFHEGEGQLQFSSAEVRDKVRKYIAWTGFDSDNLLELEMPVVFSLSSLQDVFLNTCWHCNYPYPVKGRNFISRQLFETILEQFFRQTFGFFARLSEADRPYVCVISPGPRNNEWRYGELFLEVREYFIRRLKALGVKYADATEVTCDPNGALKEEYWCDRPGDYVHANVLWGRHIAIECLELLKI